MTDKDKRQTAEEQKTAEELKAEKDLKTVQKFIYSDDIQDDFEEINNLLLPINVLEVTGMRYQEIKHSNVLAWMFGDNSHQLGHEILTKFLGKITLRGDFDSDVNKLRALRHYAFFFRSHRDIEIHREHTINFSDETNASSKRAKCSIDLLIIDKENKYIIAIENKIWSQEGDSQLSDYQKAIDIKFGDNTDHKNFRKYFIYLTPKGETPNGSYEDGGLEEDWLIADYQILYDIIDKIIKNENRDMSDEARFILQSYNDLLIKEGIVSNNDLQKLCAKIWGSKEYKEALNILFENKPDNLAKIADIIERRLKEEDAGCLLVANQIKRNIFRFTTTTIQKQYEGKQQKFYYYLEITKEGLYLSLKIHDVGDNLRERLANNNIIIRKDQKNKQIAYEAIDNWDDIKYTPVDDIKELSRREEFTTKLDKIISELKKCEKKIDSAIQQCNS